MLHQQYYEPCLLFTVRRYLSCKLQNPTKTRLQARAFVNNLEENTRLCALQNFIGILAHILLCLYQM